MLHSISDMTIYCISSLYRLNQLYATYLLLSQQAASLRQISAQMGQKWLEAVRKSTMSQLCTAIQINTTKRTRTSDINDLASHVDCGHYVADFKLQVAYL
jgi:hypothetical protein